MGEEWRTSTGGAVTLKIYPGGIAGDEDAIIRKMRVGQLQAAGFTRVWNLAGGILRWADEVDPTITKY